MSGADGEQQVPPRLRWRSNGSERQAIRRCWEIKSLQDELEAFIIQSNYFYSELMFDRNSVFPFVLLSLSISNSSASTGESGFKTFRRTQMRERSSRGMRS